MGHNFLFEINFKTQILTALFYLWASYHLVWNIKKPEQKQLNVLKLIFCKTRFLLQLIHLVLKSEPFFDDLAKRSHYLSFINSNKNKDFNIEPSISVNDEQNEVTFKTLQSIFHCSVCVVNKKEEKKNYEFNTTQHDAIIVLNK